MAPDARPAGVRGRAPRARALDHLGVLIGAALAGWTLIASVDRPHASPGPLLALLAGMALVTLATRRAAATTLVPGVIAIAVAGALALGFPGLLRAGGSPTGYANANADLAALGAISAVAAAAGSTALPARRAWTALAVASAVAVAATGSVAASLTLAVAGALALVAALRRQVLAAVAGGMIAVSVLLGVTAAIAVGGNPLGLGDRDDTRAELWAQAVDQLREEPLRGVGPAAASHHRPVVDADLRWTHHEYLQQAAEQGLVGLGLLLALIGWAYARLLFGPRHRAGARIVGAAALTLVTLHAAVDHVLHTASVPLTLAALLGWAMADDR